MITFVVPLFFFSFLILHLLMVFSQLYYLYVHLWKSLSLGCLPFFHSSLGSDRSSSVIVSFTKLERLGEYWGSAKFLIEILSKHIVKLYCRWNTLLKSKALQEMIVFFLSTVNFQPIRRVLLLKMLKTALVIEAFTFFSDEKEVDKKSCNEHMLFL